MAYIMDGRALETIEYKSFPNTIYDKETPICYYYYFSSINHSRDSDTYNRHREESLHNKNAYKAAVKITCAV